MIRVVIERHCLPGKEAELENVLMNLRTAAIHQHGYVSGETLQSVDDPKLWLVISTWADIDDWKVWETNQSRKRARWNDWSLPLL